MVNTVSEPSRDLLDYNFWFPAELELLDNQQRLDSYFSLAQYDELILNDVKDPLYKNSHPLALNTSYEDCHQLLTWAQNKSIETIMDLGCGAGRLVLLASYLFPKLKVRGVEFLADRIISAQKQLNEKANSILELGDLLDPWPNSWFDNQLYLIYLPTGGLLRNIMFQLSHKTGTFYIAAIESHGQLIHELMKDHSWIELCCKIPLKQKRHKKYIYIFRSNSREKHLSSLDGPIHFPKDRLLYDSLATRKEVVSVELKNSERRFFFSDDLHPIRYDEDQIFLESDKQDTVIKSWKSLSILGQEAEHYQKIYDILLAIEQEKVWRKVFCKDNELYIDCSRGHRHKVNNELKLL